FVNTPDTDPDLVGNRQWGRQIAQRMVKSTHGNDTVAAAQVTSNEQFDRILTTALNAQTAWQDLGATKRAEILHRAGQMLERRRGELLEVAGSECGKTLDQSDVEVSEAIDFANYYAMLGQRLTKVDGAAADPLKLIAVVPPWNFPIAIPAG